MHDQVLLRATQPTVSLTPTVGERVCVGKESGVGSNSAPRLAMNTSGLDAEAPFRTRSRCSLSDAGVNSNSQEVSSDTGGRWAGDLSQVFVPGRPGDLNGINPQVPTVPHYPIYAESSL